MEAGGICTFRSIRALPGPRGEKREEKRDTHTDSLDPVFVGLAWAGSEGRGGQLGRAGERRRQQRRRQGERSRPPGVPSTTVSHAIGCLVWMNTSVNLWVEGQGRSRASIAGLLSISSSASPVPTFSRHRGFSTNSPDWPVLKCLAVVVARRAV